MKQFEKNYKNIIANINKNKNKMERTRKNNTKQSTS